MQTQHWNMSKCLIFKNIQFPRATNDSQELVQDFLPASNLLPYPELPKAKLNLHVPLKDSLYSKCLFYFFTCGNKYMVDNENSCGSSKLTVVHALFTQTHGLFKQHLLLPWLLTHRYHTTHTMSYQSWKCRFNWHVAKVQVKLARGRSGLCRLCDL